ncbi:hypothetical protein DPX16_2669 [Anabarilius grahami]|uniref:Uncharacterized protein n=1 Tax=Anabarilius grahami TaxID=495550 RepID=A0A3N0YPG4_ANAGA|nr:hypothetical protein DPX16_2669 [Anabarilius grahami]
MPEVTSDEESFILKESLPQSSGLRNNFSPIQRHYFGGTSAQTNGSLHAKTQRPVTTSKSSAISFCVFPYSGPFNHYCHREIDNKAAEHQARVSDNAAFSREGSGLLPAPARPPQQAFNKPEPRHSADRVPSQLTLSTPSAQPRKKHSLNPSRRLS